MKVFIFNHIPLENREFQVEKLIKIRQGNTSVEEYSLKYTMFYIYTSSWVSNSTYEMIRFMFGFYDLVKEQGHTDILYDYMNIYSPTMYSQFSMESKYKKIINDVMRVTSDDKRPAYV